MYGIAREGTMREYDSAGIRNIAVVGHGGSGKTSVVDALCFAAGSAVICGPPTRGK